MDQDWSANISIPMQNIRWENGKASIPKVEFYINNTCNLTCENCNRFNNHHFTGWQNFNDYKEIIEQWSEHVVFEKLVIMGGEPLLNPSLLDWIDGLNQIFKNHVQILSNGLLLHKNKKLYDRLDGTYAYNNYIGISWHNRNHAQVLEEHINGFLQAPIQKEQSHDPLQNGSTITYIDANQVKIVVWVQDEFYDAAVHKNANNRFTLYDNDPHQAHSQCGFAIHKNYHMIKGKLYKCGPVALFPEFHQQHNFDLPEQDIDLLHSYVPLEVDQFPTLGKVFLDSIDDVLPQCKFCPVNLQSNLIYPTVKGKQLPKTNDSLS